MWAAWRATTSATIRETYVTGQVFGTDNVGGVVGRNASRLVDGSVVAGNIGVVWTNADVNADADFAGGLVGNNYARIAASYATGTVQRRRQGRAGGLVGLNNSVILSGNTAAGTVITSYATGTL